MINTTFSIILPTRNRVDLFARALKSIENQTLNTDVTVEVCVVDDGSDEKASQSYSTILNNSKLYIKHKILCRRKAGHGPGYARNEGAAMATGEFLCFLDDDDEWTDCEHLQRAFKALKEGGTNDCIYLTNQKAFEIDGKQKREYIWTEDLIEKFDINETTKLPLNSLMTSVGFTHLNCLIVARELYLKIDGYDESLRYEGDRDLFMRLADAADSILFSPHFVANHYIPDSRKRLNTSTLVNQKQKLQYQIYSNQKLISLNLSSPIIKRCKEHLSNCFKKLTEISLKEKDIVNALMYAKQALASKYSVKWAFYCLLLQAKKWTTKNG